MGVCLLLFLCAQLRPLLLLFCQSFLFLTIPSAMNCPFSLLDFIFIQLSLNYPFNFKHLFIYLFILLLLTNYFFISETLSLHRNSSPHRFNHTPSLLPIPSGVPRVVLQGVQTSVPVEMKPLQYDRYRCGYTAPNPGHTDFSLLAT